jgi:RNA-binding protein
MPLSTKRRSELRAEAHTLSPVVIIGNKGLTDEVVAEIDRALKAHELIKVRAVTDDRPARTAWMKTICERLAAHEVQQIGKVLVIYRENPEQARDTRREAPEEKRGARREAREGAPSGTKKSRASSLAPSPKGTSRPRSRTPSPRPESEPRRRRPRTSR